jgi:hypothetical protein
MRVAASLGELRAIIISARKNEIVREMGYLLWRWLI